MCIRDSTSTDVSEGIEQLETRLQEFGVDEIQGIKLYGLEQLTEEERKDMEAIISIYGETEYIPCLLYTSRCV